MPTSALENCSRGLSLSAPETAPASVTSRPSRIQVTPSATTTSVWKRPQCNRSRRAGMSVSTSTGAAASSFCAMVGPSLARTTRPIVSRTADAPPRFLVQYPLMDLVPGSPRPQLIGYGAAACLVLRHQEPQGAPMSTTTWIVIGVIALLVVWSIVVYNGLVAMRQRVNQAYADIDVQMKQRHDLIPNLVETVKGYAGHERNTLEAVVRARNAATQAQPGGGAQQAQAENMLSGALRQLFALSEAYPDLKANQNFQQLQNELSDIENKLAAARRFFNNAVQEYNTGIQQFPAVFLA